MREAARALKGSILRQEVYADDGSAEGGTALQRLRAQLQADLPATAGAEPPRRLLHAIRAKPSTITTSAIPADPRISHALTLAVDDYGNVLKSAAIGYQRRTPAFDEQKKTLATLTESQYTNAVLEDDAYRTPLPAEVKTYELTAPTLKGATPLDFATVDAHRGGRKRNRL